MNELLIWSDPSEGREGVSRGWGGALMKRKEEQKLLMLIKINFV